MLNIVKSLGLFLIFILIFSSVHAQNTDLQNLLSLSLDDLMKVQIVTSVGKKEQNLNNAAAAIFVITQEDIQRIGATTLADALRLAPGVQVARYNSHGWAISIRGFNNFFSDKLLVLIDGHSIYNPIFAGVYWDTLDTLLNDIERIEIIRGPGGTLWGANAMNGVINIITKHAQDTQGTWLKLAAGNELKYLAEWRYGGELIDNKGQFRVYAKKRSYDALARAQEPSDAWQMTQAGFRIDGQMENDTQWRVQSDVYQQHLWETPLLSEMPLSAENNVAMRLNSDIYHPIAEDSTLTLQSSLEWEKRNAADVGTQLTSFKIGFEHLHRFNKNHEINWGASYYFNHLDAYSLIPYNGFVPNKHNEYLLSFFMQHDWALLPEELTFTLGTKIEFNELNHLQYQPSVRFSWQLLPNYHLWGAVSRAIRTQSLVNRFFTIERKIADNANPFYPLDFIFKNAGNTFQPESLLAYELGIRANFSQLNLSLSAFQQNYSNMVNSVGYVVPELAQGRVILFNQVTNATEGSVYGGEITADGRFNAQWRWQAAYSFLESDLNATLKAAEANTIDAEQNNPRHQWALRSLLTIGENWQWDLGLRYIDDIVFNNQAVADYWQLDSRLAYAWDKNITLSLVGQNLLSKYQDELSTVRFNPLYRANERSFYGQIQWQFE
jgi:iron complex outermembrane recepter protein